MRPKYFWGPQTGRMVDSMALPLYLGHMKALCLLSPLWILTSLPMWAQNGGSDLKKTANIQSVDEMLPNQRAFLNLSQEKRDEFVKQFREGNRLFSQKRIFEALDTAETARKIFPESPEVYNLMGSCYVEMRSFDKALASFQKAATLTIRTHNIMFNIGEVYFVTKQWQKSMETFQQLLQSLPANDIHMGRLAEFKILLCKIKLDKIDEAKILAEKYDFLDDSPYHYFAKAAIDYQAGRLAEAEQWLGRATRIFRSQERLSPWHDTLVEFGYIKSFYGEDEVAP